MAWKLEKSSVVVDSPWLRVYKNDYYLPNGDEVADYYIIERADFVLVIAEREGSVVLVRQYRPATQRYYHALPAGYLHPGETAETAALRELEEETGLTSSDPTKVGELHALPGYIRSTAHVVRCRALVGHVAVRDKGEIESVVMAPWHEVLAMVRHGEINEMQAVAALLLVRQLDIADT